jgi:hypothetical protein
MARGVSVWNHTMRNQALADPSNGVPSAIHDDYRFLE